MTFENAKTGTEHGSPTPRHVRHMLAATGREADRPGRRGASAGYADVPLRATSPRGGDEVERANASDDEKAQAPAGGGGGAAPAPAPAAGQPGESRTVSVQPVVFRTGAADAAPTGGSWSRRFGPSNTIWGKLGVSFNDSTAVVIDNATLKTGGGTRAQRDAIRAAHSDAGKVCVFLTDNDLTDVGGGATVGGGAAGAKIALSDRGTSNTLLAHELGHVLGLDHPPASDANTIMEPSGSINSDNPTRNTLGNYRRITWPAPSGSTTINPDA